MNKLYTHKPGFLTKTAQVFLVLLSFVIINGAWAQGVTKNGKVTTTGGEYVSKNGGVGGISGVNKNGQLVMAGPILGSPYQGGIVFYIFVSGDPGYIAGETHGLIAASGDVGGRVAWGCGDYNGDGSADVTVTGTQNGLGYGNQNTIIITSACTTSGIAAKICNDLVLNSYSDWYLPSFTELNILYNNRGLVGGFQASIYWSSSQGGGNQFYAKGRWFSSTLSGDYNRTNTYYVRPIRTF